jgi:phosphonate transport system substrate-binding protein
MRYLKKVFLILFLMVISTSVWSKDTIYFAPLPMKKAKKIVQDLLPLVEYLQEKLSVEIKFNYKSDYGDILKGFENNTIDIAVLGPLPYVILKSHYSYVEPIVLFKQKNGSTHYRCVLSKFVEDDINVSKPIKIALTQPLSTCGYYMSKKLLKKRYNIDIKDQYYKYTMSHTNAMTGALKGEFDIAGASEFIAQKYESLGMETVAQSELLPGFSIVVNTTTLSADMIQRLRDALLSIPPSSLKAWGGKSRYGLSRANAHLYDSIKVDFDIPKKGNL